ncbi:MAG: DNA polymerase III subunit gamma/tau [Victivallaceae bacterium]
MAEYQVIARKWRPQSFADVVGQEHVVRTLKNAIRQNRTAHAYLFVGPRGVGKTTLARIFAKAMNCEHPVDGEPCCKCRSCLAIAADNSLDLIEIDAASHNSVGEMRELADEVVHAPTISRYKIYIIDEVHMLSKQAWNALLKTVEEPPAHVKFIFATTEVHQVLPTIISRCQRFDLLPIPTRLIAGRLARIAEAEQVKIEPGAINAIARAAAGGMRDAQSLLDQMIAFFAQDEAHPITGEQVLSLFGLTDRRDLDALLKAMLENRPGEVVSLINSLSRRGKNLETLFDDLLAALRAIRIALVLKNPGEILEEDPETVASYREIAAAAPADAVPVLLENLAPVGRVLHDALNKQIFLETILLKAMREAHAVKLNDILARLNQLRKAGELKFLDDLPAAQVSVRPAALPVETAAPAPMIEVKPEPKAPTRPEVVAAPAPEPVPVKPEEIETAEPEPEEEKVLTPQQAGAELLAKLRRMAAGLASSPVLTMGTAELKEGSTLAVGFGINTDLAAYAKLEADLPSYQKLIQEVTGDWAANVLFHRQTLIEPVAEAEPEPGLPETELEIQPEEEDSVAAENEAEAQLAELAERREEPVVPVVLNVEPVVVPNLVVEPEPMVPKAKRGVKRRSVVNDDPMALERVKERPMVAQVLDLFGGEVVDVHVPQQ